MKTLRYLALFAAVTASALISAPAAHADTLHFTYGWCEQGSGTYQAPILCHFGYAGAAGTVSTVSVTSRWGSVSEVSTTDAQAEYEGFCDVGHDFDMTLTITDGVTTVSDWGYVTCLHDGP